MKGLPSKRLTPSTVTCLSCMASSRADCVLGVALFISSANKIFVIIGPSTKVNASSFWLYILSPVISAGKRSGVNCILENFPSMEDAMTFASVVFPVPGVSSKSTCPPATSVVMTRSMVFSFPIITFLILLLRASILFFASSNVLTDIFTPCCLSCYLYILYLFLS